MLTALRFADDYIAENGDDHQSISRNLSGPKDKVGKRGNNK